MVGGDSPTPYGTMVGKFRGTCAASRSAKYRLTRLVPDRSTRTTFTRYVAFVGHSKRQRRLFCCCCFFSDPFILAAVPHASTHPPVERTPSGRTLPAGTITLADAGRRQRQQIRLLFALMWLVPGTFAGVVAWVMWSDIAGALTLSAALLWQLGGWMTWAVWSQGILSLSERVKLAPGELRQWMLIHLVGAGVVATVNAVLIAALGRRFSPELSNTVPFVETLRFEATQHLAFEFMLYWAVLGAAHMLDFRRRYRERDLAATVLEQRLARKQLEALRMQLNPHFLFNALNSVTELMETDVRTAQRALSAVSDLLRLSLKSAGTPTIPLWQEIELVELYLQVARIRYGAGLEIDIDVDSTAVDLDVPSFVLQPLVENSLKHGLSPGRRQQSVHVTATRVGSMLHLTVEDNGRGLDGRLTDSGRFLAATPSIEGLGIGLTNTRTRLTMIYGDRYSFRMGDSGDGGCKVEIQLPLTASPVVKPLADTQPYRVPSR